MIEARGGPLSVLGRYRAKEGLLFAMPIRRKADATSIEAHSKPVGSLVVVGGF